MRSRLARHLLRAVVALLCVYVDDLDLVWQRRVRNVDGAVSQFADSENPCCGFDLVELRADLGHFLNYLCLGNILGNNLIVFAMDHGNFVILRDFAEDIVHVFRGVYFDAIINRIYLE